MQSRLVPDQKALKLLAAFMRLRKRPLITFWKDYSLARKETALAVGIILSEYDRTPLWPGKDNDRKYWEEVLQHAKTIVP
jgi:hypothetical protein